MNVKVFVTGSASILAAWLAVTFVRDVPGENYPQLGRESKPQTAKLAPPAAPAAVMLPQLAEAESE